ncbi:Nitrate/nitrite response regulator protein [Saliniradius amylolyticus]|uniref:Nitrate/nitrite response regulator protein n=1 Tax=Saliniradius amylolyticus TaxID=2183582 RepID=A0A2S2E2C2_9ALTE|nr:response regulator transcription factor [Saliniradius amylolyticus]AWL11783.1 Nitrate/nitrite response regulator protein [Saliniradius amylolyticus]
MSQYRAIIADDHPLFRSAMKQAVQSVIGDQLLETASLEQTMEALARHPDIELVMLDLNMPGNDGLTGLSLIRHTYPGVQVLIVSAEEEPSMIAKALEFGASGYLPKSAPLDNIEIAITKVLDGEQWLPEGVDSLIEQLGQSEHADFARQLEQLTPHQLRVLKYIADGLLNKQIAYEMQVQETTVKQHVSAILRKLDVINRTQAGILFRQAMER